LRGSGVSMFLETVELGKKQVTDYTDYLYYSLIKTL